MSKLFTKELLSELEPLKDEVILVTGSSSGFGRATAQLLAIAGANVIAAARRKERLIDIASDNIIPYQLDVRDEEAVKELAEKYEFTALINNAGLALGLEPAHKADLHDWKNMVDTNILGVIYCTHYILPGMMERNKGYIINIGSIAANTAYPGGNVYGATKAFVKQFSLNLRADLLGSNIRITDLEPGLAETEFSVVRFKGNQEKADNVYRNTQPLTPQDIADNILWLLTLPDHVNVNFCEIMPVCQAFAPFAIARG